LVLTTDTRGTLFEGAPSHEGRCSQRQDIVRHRSSFSFSADTIRLTRAELNSWPHIPWVIAFTLRADTPCRYICIMAAVKAFSLR
jgi:hypothetical protein